jgi:hypothetical protein
MPTPPRIGYQSTRCQIHRENPPTVPRLDYNISNHPGREYITELLVTHRIQFRRIPARAVRTMSGGRSRTWVSSSPAQWGRGRKYPKACGQPFVCWIASAALASAGAGIENRVWRFGRQPSGREVFTPGWRRLRSPTGCRLTAICGIPTARRHDVVDGATRQPRPWALELN